MGTRSIPVTFGDLEWALKVRVSTGSTAQDSAFSTNASRGLSLLSAIAELLVTVSVACSS